ncbi:MAG: SAM-dependent methyltransferase [Spirochaetales bacterium]|nr:SAM-dependent methyltransferase [Spirochaetales bacterium]
MESPAEIEQALFNIQPIGYIRRDNDSIWLEIEEDFRPALKELERFSHCLVFWWVDQLDDETIRAVLEVELPYAPDVTAGVFACRSPVRPNPIAVTTCKIEGIDEKKGIMRITNIDAFDGTPVIDVKAYIPVCDRVKEYTVPAWLEDWPQWLPDQGIGLED